MTAKTTVLVNVSRDEGRLAPLVRSLDAQTLPIDDFEVIWTIDPAATALGERLADLVRRRPNMAVSGSADEVGTALPADWREPTGSGEWLLRLPADQGDIPLLAPDALERLSACAEAADTDVVLGRVSEVAPSSIAWPVVSSGSGPDTSDFAELGPSLALRRRGKTDERVTILPGRPVATVAARPDTSQDALSIVASDTEAGWDAGRFSATVTVRSLSPVPADLVAVPVLRERASGDECWLTDCTATGADRSVCAEIVVDVGALHLRRGEWRLELAVGTGGLRSSLVPFPATTAPGGLVDGRLVVVVERDGALVLDVGATVGSVLRRLDPAQVTIVESAGGTLMTVDLPDVEVHGESRLRGSVYLGGFRLAAVLVGDRLGARLQCHLSGLAGTSPISTRFGSRKQIPTGLDLEISPVGVMTVHPAKPAAAKRAKSAKQAVALKPKPAKQRVSKPEATAAPPPPSRLRSLRRSVPAPLEPAVRRLAKNPSARRVYRSLTGAERADR